MEPIWQPLRTKPEEDGWDATHKGCLKSILANRQFPQTRVKNCGWSQHDRCLLCLSGIADNDGQESSDSQQQQQQQQQQQPSGILTEVIGCCSSSRSPPSAVD